MFNLRSDLQQKRDFISLTPPKDFRLKNEYINLNCIYKDFEDVARYIVYNTRIHVECAYLFMCAHILSGFCGRGTIINGDHYEAPVLQVLGFASSGKRKSVVNDRLCAPVIDFQKKIKEKYNSDIYSSSTHIINNIKKNS